MNKLNFFQKRDFGENVSFTFQFVKENFIHFFVNIFILSIPIWILIGLGMYSQVDKITEFADSFSRENIYALQENISVIFGIIISIFVLSLLWATYLYAVMYSYYFLYMEKGPKGFNLQELLARAIGSMSRLLIANISLFGVGFVMMIVLGLMIGLLKGFGVFLTVVLSVFFIIYAIRMSFYSIIVIKEKTSVWQAIQKSFFLVKDHWWETFGLFFVFAIIAGIINWIIEQSLGLLGTDIIKVDLLIAGSFDMTIGTIIMYIIFNSLASVLTNLFSTTAIFAQYGSLVEEKEGVHLKQNIDKLGTTSDTEKEEEDF